MIHQIVGRGKERERADRRLCHLHCDSVCVYVSLSLTHLCVETRAEQGTYNTRSMFDQYGLHGGNRPDDYIQYKLWVFKTQFKSRAQRLCERVSYILFIFPSNKKATPMQESIGRNVMDSSSNISSHHIWFVVSGWGVSFSFSRCCINVSSHCQTLTRLHVRL